MDIIGCLILCKSSRKYKNNYDFDFEYKFHDNL